MRLRAVALGLALAGGMLVRAGGPAAACGESAPPLRFRPPVFIDTERHGGEPVSVVARDGSIVVAAHRGDTHLYLYTAPEPGWYAQYAPQALMWRSTDGGATWSRIELLPGVSMHSALSDGFSDPDLTRDDAGNLYGTEGRLAHVSVFSSHDGGATWPDANPLAGYGDRPWLAARGDGEVYLHTSYTGSNLFRSKDGGRTWTQTEAPSAHFGRLLADPSDSKGLMMPTWDGGGVQVSRDDGETWEAYYSGGHSTADIPSIAVDREGWVYNGHIERGRVRFSSWNPATVSWSGPTDVPMPGGGRAFWSWSVAGDAGRAAVAWYEAVPVGLENGPFSTYEVRVWVAVTTNARDCPRFSVGDAVGRPVHVGQIPCFALGCNIAGDRRLGDFFTVNYDAGGRVFVTTGDTTMKVPVAGAEYQTSRPLFAGAGDESPRLLAP